MSWDQFLKGVFEIDMAHSSHCGGPLTLIAAIYNPAVIDKILAHLGLPTRAPSRSPAPDLRSLSNGLMPSGKGSERKGKGVKI